ncbi:MAG: 5-formyltetrahydrofolate cyclo-ligase [Cyanobacteria bacterium P01_G01_bin.67]
MTESSKSSLRRKILQQRQSLSPLEWQTRSSLICDRLQSSVLFKEAKTILAYFSFRQEADLTPIFTLDKNWAFPRCVGKSLVWHSWQPGENLQSGQYGIKEPLPSASVILPAYADLILVPTVAADGRGYRLGYGGGFYDRLLSSEEGSAIATIGIVFDFAYISELPIDSWDVKLNFICTETNFDIY